ncbi:hypothetical protein ABT063_46215 [Streptomyces sp. NPDC002838]|uniref:hypothetical protein n=1 Tax=Streptomyces sp. NPDC002838 TaxID=3154436 RepID=UPI00332C324E
MSGALSECAVAHRGLDRSPGGERERKVHLDLTGVHHLDLACRRQVEEWARQRLTTGSVEVRVLMPTAAGEPDAPAVVAGTTRNAALPEAVASGSRKESPPGSKSP